MNFVSEPRERIYSIRKKVNQAMMSFGTLLPTHIRANIVSLVLVTSTCSISPGNPRKKIK